MLKLKSILLFILVIGCLKQSTAQIDTVLTELNKPKKSWLKKSIFPTTLIITGFALNKSQFETLIDDYIQKIISFEDRSNVLNPIRHIQRNIKTYLQLHNGKRLKICDSLV